MLNFCPRIRSNITTKTSRLEVSSLDAKMTVRSPAFDHVLLLQPLD